MKFEINVEAEVMEMVRKVAEMRGTKVSETVEFLVGTGAGRYIAASKWAKANKPAAKPRAKKAAAKKAAPKAKAPTVRKAAAKAEEAAPVHVANGAAEPPAASPLD